MLTAVIPYGGAERYRSGWGPAPPTPPKRRVSAFTANKGRMHNRKPWMVVGFDRQKDLHGNATLLEETRVLLARGVFIIGVFIIIIIVIISIVRRVPE